CGVRKEGVLGQRAMFGCVCYCTLGITARVLHAAQDLDLVIHVPEKDLSQRTSMTNPRARMDSCIFTRTDSCIGGSTVDYVNCGLLATSNPEETCRGDHADWG
ncbi:unnamed protein product, partial [Ectocarpus sp. 8 AP-2014]